MLRENYNTPLFCTKQEMYKDSVYVCVFMCGCKQSERVLGCVLFSACVVVSFMKTYMVWWAEM